MNLKVRLAVMNFLEFAVWGAYLTSMGNYLGKVMALSVMVLVRPAKLLLLSLRVLRLPRRIW